MGIEELTDRFVNLEEFVRRIVLAVGNGLGSREVAALADLVEQYNNITNEITKDYE